MQENLKVMCSNLAQDNSKVFKHRPNSPADDPSGKRSGLLIYHPFIQREERDRSRIVSFSQKKSEK
jgi:hypothetical protein